MGKRTQETFIVVDKIWATNSRIKRSKNIGVGSVAESADVNKPNIIELMREHSSVRRGGSGELEPRIQLGQRMRCGKMAIKRIRPK